MNEAELVTDSVDSFLTRLASAAPTPGGGSAAAVMGAMGAALLSMVGNLTVGKKGYESVEERVKDLLPRTEALREKLTGMVAADVAAFEVLMAAYRLPKANDADKAVRSDAIQSALKRATEVPLHCARTCAQVIQLALDSAQTGSTQVISDAGVGVLAAEAALRSAALNVYINAPALKDRTFAAAVVREVDSLQSECRALTEQVYQLVRERMAS